MSRADPPLHIYWNTRIHLKDKTVSNINNFFIVLFLCNIVTDLLFPDYLLPQAVYKLEAKSMGGGLMRASFKLMTWVTALSIVRLAFWWLHISF